MAAAKPRPAVSLSSSSLDDQIQKDLFEACRIGDLNRVRKIASTSNVNCRDISGRKSSPLHFAAGFGRREIVEHLISLGAVIDMKDDGGLIPLHNACSFGHADVARLLLKHGSDVNALDNWNFTPLHEAASKGKVDVCIGMLLCTLMIFFTMTVV